MPTVRDFARLERENWDDLGANALARELFQLLNKADIPASPGDGGGTGTGTGTGSGNGFDGEVISGTGTTYQVRLHTGTEVSATVPGILSTETIPAGAHGPVIQKEDGTYLLLFPLWLN